MSKIETRNFQAKRKTYLPRLPLPLSISIPYLFSYFVEISIRCTICAVSANSNSNDCVLQSLSTAVFLVPVQLTSLHAPAAATGPAANSVTVLLLWLSGKSVG